MSRDMFEKKFSDRSSAEISRWRPPLPPAAGRNTPLYATRLRLPLAAAGAARHSNRACRLQPAWSARGGKSFPINSPFIGVISS